MGLPKEEKFDSIASQCTMTPARAILRYEISQPVVSGALQHRKADDYFHTQSHGCLLASSCRCALAVCSRQYVKEDGDVLLEDTTKAAGACSVCYSRSKS